jgi:hypothetical protein
MQLSKVVACTSSAVLATVSNPMYAKNSVAAPPSIPLTPYGKYLQSTKNPKGYQFHLWGLQNLLQKHARKCPAAM